MSTVDRQHRALADAIGERAGDDAAEPDAPSADAEQPRLGGVREVQISRDVDP